MQLPVITKVDVCIYHSPCSDGFGAAWACWKRFGDSVEFLPGIYAENREDEAYWLEKVRDKHVVVGDFSFERELTEKLHAAAASLTVIDHHESAAKKLEGLDYCYYSGEHSGAILMWKACFATKGKIPHTHFGPILPPTLLHFVEDEDLWTWKLGSAHEICAYIKSLPFDFEAWNRLAHDLEELKGGIRIRELGAAMLSKQEAIANSILDGAEEWSFCGHKILAANCPSILGSLVCEMLSKLGEFPFVGAYRISKGKVTWSLRSTPETEDVSAIARCFGGDGHTEAAGASMPVTEVDFINRIVRP